MWLPFHLIKTLVGRMADLRGPGDVFSDDVLKWCNNKITSGTNKYQYVASVMATWALNTDASVKSGVRTKGDHKHDDY